MGLSIWVRSFLNPYFPSPDVLLPRHRRSSIAEKWLSVSELSDSSPTKHWVSEGHASWQMVLILQGFPAGEHSLFRISLWVTHHTDSGSCPWLSLHTQTFWWHYHIDSGEKSGKQGAVDTAKLQLPYPFLSSFSNHTRWGTYCWRWSKIKWSHHCLFFPYENGIFQILLKKKPTCSPECEATAWFWSRAGV